MVTSDLEPGTVIVGTGDLVEQKEQNELYVEEVSTRILPGSGL